MTGHCRSNTRVQSWWKQLQQVGSLIAVIAVLPAAEIKDLQKAYLEGRYDDVVEQASSLLSATPNNSDASMLLVQAQLAVGHNVDAYIAMNAALSRDTQNIRLRWLARDVAYANGKPDEAAKRVDEIRKMVQSSPWSYRAPPDMVVFGQTMLQLGVDPKDVLDKIFGTAQKADPKYREVYLARGELALEKHDFALAAKAFEEGLKAAPDDPDLLSGRGRAYASGDREIALAAWRSALKINSRHVPSLLQLANHHIDAEEYDAAGTVLDNAIRVNPTDPEAWAYRAVIAHLKNDSAAEQTARETALSTWAQNPRVDNLIGEKLSAKYRFAEGAAYQRKAREFAPSYLPAMAQLASDLLRLGNETEGWGLAKAVHERDEYDVEAFNLVTLHDTMTKYAALTDDDFVLRMAAPEVAIFGPRVLALLRKAQTMLTQKYGVQLAKPTYVEVFADEKDFAVRTFGLPDVPGFLGVCFGRVVTANSPSTRSTPTNWESVLWHEFCHVITLQMTKNKMPRWLSEGISVYEEWQAEPSWGMRVDSKYRDMMLGDDLVPVGKLSGAFLAPKTPKHLQFAYLESAVVVEYIVKQYGIENLRQVLRDLSQGVEINTALARHTVELPELEKGFAAYARERAQKVGPKLDWAKPEPELLLPENALDLLAWETKHPDNYWMIRHRTQQLMEIERWADVRSQLQRLVELYPEQKGSDTAYRPLVASMKALGDAAGERTVLHQWVKIDDEAPDAYLRLMELAAADKDWTTVADNAERYLRVNPLVAPPYRYEAQARTAAGDVAEAVTALRTLLLLDVPDKSDAHYQLGTLLHRRGDDDAAKRHVLMALEDTPRYRDALRLLVELERNAANKPAATPNSRPPASPEKPAARTPPIEAPSTTGAK